jgi:hypothetical protein
MKGDNSRSTFQREKHYTGVRMQQGRVLLDAEWNEQADIQNSLGETANTDIIGASGASRISGGFLIVPAGNDLILTPGRMWVDGILCECEAPEFLNATKNGAATVQITADWVDRSRFVRGTWLQLSDAADNIEYARISAVNQNNKTITFTGNLTIAAVVKVRPVYSYTTQPHDPKPAFIVPGSDPATIGIGANFVAYLDVWTRHLTAVEDPSIREIALGGPDTTTRTQTIWQVRLQAGVTCENVSSPAHASRMLAQTTAVPASNDPCTIPSNAGYRGLANQLYRVEVHAPGNQGVATFKWSRDNAAFVFPIEGAIPGQGNQLRLGSLGRDDRFGLNAKDWVELTDDVLELQGLPGRMVKVLEKPQEHSRILVVDPATLPLNYDFNNPNAADGPVLDFTRGAKVRLWSYDPTAVNPPGTQTITNAVIPLESGIEVQFSGTGFRSGEYWLVPARTAINDETGDIEWPRTGSTSIPQPPRGIDHHHAALSDVTVGGQLTADDCRPLFSPLVAPELFYCGGDGQEVMPPDLTANTPVKLPFPLKVGVANGGPIADAHVRFVGTGLNAAAGTPVVSQVGNTLVVKTKADGTAEVEWTLTPPAHAHTCTATLLKGNGQKPVTLPSIDFHGFLSMASQVAYDPDNCEHLKDLNVRNVQDALDEFCDLLDDPHLYFIGGDGQEAERLLASPSPLPAKIEVGVANAIGPVAGQQVRFKPSDGGTITPAGDATTDANGRVAVEWSLDGGAGEPQTNEAWLLDENGVETGLPVIFKATFAQTGGGVCTFIVEPVPNWHLPLQNIAPGQDAEICFTTGDFPLAEPLVITNAGVLKITGTGSGTRIRCLDSETAIRFIGCQEVLVRDVYAEVGPAFREKFTRGLLGVLQFESCVSVELENVRLRNASGPERASSCITIHSDPYNPEAEPPEDPLAPLNEARDVFMHVDNITASNLPVRTAVTIRDCDLQVGHEQVGILVVDPLVARIEDNILRPRREPIPMPELLKNDKFAKRFSRRLVSAPFVGEFQNRDDDRVHLTWQFGNQFANVVFQTDQPALKDEWLNVSRKFAPTDERPSTVIAFLRRFAAGIVAEHGASGFPAFGEWFADQTKDPVLPQIGQAIVIGGVAIGEVQIRGNRIDRANEGIHVGASRDDNPNSRDHIAADRITIADNAIGLVQERTPSAARHGIHAASCKSLMIESNRIHCRRWSNNIKDGVQGIWVSGSAFGRFLGVVANHVSDCDVFIHPRFAGDDRQWFATDNLTERGTNDIFDTVRQSPPNTVFL